MDTSESTAERIDPKSIAITGATGLIGTALRGALEDQGHTVLQLTRRPTDSAHQIYWSPRGNEIDAARLEGIDAVVHLAGENLFGRWTDDKKEAILQSRAQGTDLLARTLARLNDPPAVFVSASAVGYYGNTGHAVVDEESPPGQTFLAEVCRQWEQACQPAIDAGIRTTNPRLGVVLSRDGGALKLMLTPFRLGLGAHVGDGRQFMSWIALTDVVRGLQFLLDNDQLDGPVNLTSPNPVSNAELTETLGQVLHRPTILGLPGALVRLGAGQMGEEMLLHGQRAVPARLQKNGFEFAFPKLEAALRHELAA